jgi:hypothetical protein
MNRIVLTALLLAANASAQIIPMADGEYSVEESGYLEGRVIIRLYEQADDFCLKQGKEVATIKLEPTPQQGPLPRRRPEMRLLFQCVSKSTTCGMLVPNGASINDSGDVKLKDGTVTRYKRCSDAEHTREPPPP